MTKEYTGKERIEAVFRREKADRLPVVLGLTVHCATQAGYQPNEVRLDPEKAWKTFLLSEETFPTDMPRVPSNPYLPDVLKAGKDTEMKPQKGRIYRLADKENLKTFSYRPPKESRTFTTYLEMAKKSVATLTDRALFAEVGGPFSIAADLRGIQQIIYDTFDDPEYVHEVMKVATKLSLDRALALVETGIYLRIGDPSASCSLISPKIYREFVMSYHQQLLSELRKNTDTRIGLHICGNIDPIMEEILSLPIDWFEIDALSSLEKMVSLSQGKIVIRGQIPMETFLDGTREDIQKEVKRCVDIAGSTRAFMLAPGCTVPFNAPMENIQVFLDAACEYGSYKYIDNQ